MRPKTLDASFETQTNENCGSFFYTRELPERKGSRKQENDLAVFGVRVRVHVRENARTTHKHHTLHHLQHQTRAKLEKKKSTCA
jgi:hypothetical protein